MYPMARNNTSNQGMSPVDNIHVVQDVKQKVSLKRQIACRLQHRSFFEKMNLASPLQLLLMFSCS